MNHSIAVEAINLSVRYGDFIAVDNVSFSVNKGEIFGFLGANGAGKTTTIRVLCGLLHPSEGSVCVAGIAFDSKKDEMLIKHQVGYMSQKFTLYNDLTVEENLSFMASLRNLNTQRYVERRRFILEFISFSKPLNTFVKDLPGGIKQQVSLAAAILHDPEIVFLDEPTAGVTPAMRARFWALIRDLASMQKTVFVTTHYMDEAEQCGRIAMMRTGKIIGLDSPSNLKASVFPEKIYEFTPKTDVSYAQIEELKKYPEFDYFEPFGLRFHGTFQKTEKAEVFRKTLAEKFDIARITGSLYHGAIFSTSDCHRIDFWICN
jgi:ABC-2 type transport system ATP-binding protein